MTVTASIEPGFADPSDASLFFEGLDPADEKAGVRKAAKALRYDVEAPLDRELFLELMSDHKIARVEIRNARGFNLVAVAADESVDVVDSHGRAWDEDDEFVWQEISDALEELMR